MSLTGDKQSDLLILQQLSDKDLVNACKSSKYIRSLCQDDKFWLNRIVNKFGVKTLELKRPEESYRNFYTNRLYIVSQLCSILRKDTNFQLPIQAFYDPLSGYINVEYLRAKNLTDYILLKILYNRIQNKNILNQVNTALGNIPDYNRSIVDSETDKLTEKDIKAFLNLINISMSRNWIIRKISRGFPTLASNINKVVEFPFAVSFFIRIHDGFRTGEIPLDITWDKLCKSAYVLSVRF